jgi:hypothetical protein
MYENILSKHTNDKQALEDAQNKEFSDFENTWNDRFNSKEQEH